MSIIVGHTMIRCYDWRKYLKCVSIPSVMSLSSCCSSWSAFVVVSVSRSGSSQPAWSTLQISIISWAAWGNTPKAGPSAEPGLRWDRQQTAGTWDTVGVGLPDRWDPGARKAKRFVNRCEGRKGNKVMVWGHTVRYYPPKTERASAEWRRDT